MEDSKIEFTMKSVYTLHRNSDVGADIKDKEVYLHKNGRAVYCPYMSKADLENGLIAFRCGSFCHHFNMLPQRDKENKETGKVIVVISCGSTLNLPIANINIKPPAPVPSQQQPQKQAEMKVEKGGE